MKQIRWGIAGTGRIAHSFARDLRFVPNGELVAVASRSAVSAEEFARIHGIPRAHAGYEHFMADPGVDAVYIATPHSYHLAHSIAALRAGKAVLCEKPLTLNLEECRALLAVARETGVYLMEGMK
jgi:predicted dehydrogenase